MNYFHRVSICALLIIVSSSYAIIRELSTMANLLASVQYDKNTLFIFDVDNTIAEPHQLLGSDQWFSDLVRQGIPVDEILDIYVPVQKMIFLHLVEPMTANIIKQLQKKGVPVIALTARSDYLIDRTIEQLKHLSIDFSRTRNAAFKIKPFDLINFSHAHYKKGIIFCGHNDKGTVLMHALNELGYRPDKVVVIDDKLSNVASVDRALTARDIPCDCFHYTFLDWVVTNFDPAKARLELEDFCVQHAVRYPGQISNAGLSLCK